jgi:hypothetical protein
MPEEKNDLITISQTGEVVIKDEKLAEFIKKLSPEELQQLSIPRPMSNAGCTNIPCNLK